MVYYYSDVIVDIVVYIDDILIICSVFIYNYIYIRFYTYPSQNVLKNDRHVNPTMNTQLLHSNVMDEHQPYWNPGNLNDFQQRSKLVNAKEKGPLRRKASNGFV